MVLATNAEGSEWVNHDSDEWYELQELYTGDDSSFEWYTVAKFTDLMNEDEAGAILQAYRTLLDRPSDLKY